MQPPVLKTLSLPLLAAQAALWMLASAPGAVAIGQETEYLQTESDAEGVEFPERVARLSFTQGVVSLQAVGETEWAPAAVNRPLTPGDYLRTDPGGRAEVQLEEAAVRLGAGTNFTFLTLEESALRMRVSSGVLNIRVRDLGENDVIEVETPQATAAILRPGNYRLEVDPAGGATVVKVSSGMLEARGAGQSLVVRAQQTATLTGTDRLAYTTGTLGAPDSFDEWSLERDQRIDNVLSTESSRYVSRDVVGYEDLDRYGTWRSEPEYGYVWSPHVVSGWSPYRFGRYSYISGWGWTWIDNEPWGFAPFHYGNWITIGGRWCWVPGPRHGWPIRRPINRPSSPSHEWHVPVSPTRGITTRDADRQANNRFRTVPDGGDRSRYVRPDVPRNQIPRPWKSQPDAPNVGSPGSPPAYMPPQNDRRIRIPRNELPRSTYPRTDTFPRNDTRVGGRAPVMRSSPGQAESPRQTPRPVMSQPSPPPQQQSTSPNTSRPTMGRGNSGGRPRMLER